MRNYFAIFIGVVGWLLLAIWNEPLSPMWWLSAMTGVSLACFVIFDAMSRDLPDDLPPPLRQKKKKRASYP